MKINNIYLKNFIKKNILFIKPGLAITKFGGFESKDLDIIKSNKKFKNRHDGERCFILGNGPSLRNEDLSKLSNEVVFAVNQIAKLDDYKSIRPDYYFCVDQVFFSLNPSDEEDAQTINTFLELKNEKCDPQCFIPARFKKDIRRYGLNDLKVNYFIDAYRMTDKYNGIVDYSKVVPSFGTVVQYAITMAVYMGFKEIYLLGCDNTGILVTINSVLKEDNQRLYAYKVSDEENRRMERMVSRNGLEAYCESYLCTLQDYRKLFLYCKRNNVKLVNCSSTTVIDSIPRMEFENLF